MSRIPGKNGQPKDEVQEPEAPTAPEVETEPVDPAEAPEEPKEDSEVEPSTEEAPVPEDEDDL